MPAEFPNSPSGWSSPGSNEPGKNPDPPPQPFPLSGVDVDGVELDMEAAASLIGQSVNPENVPQPESRVTASGAGLRVDGVPETDPGALLMQRLADGDETAFASLLEQYRTPVIRFVFRMVPDAAASEELAQEVFLRVYKSRASYRPTAKFTTWLFRIASHLALNWIRDHKKERGNQSLDQPEPESGSGAERYRQVADESASVEQDLILEARAAEIRAAVEALPANQRAAVLLHKYEGLGYAEIARALELSDAAVKSVLFRAYQSLRGRLAHLAPEARTK